MLLVTIILIVNLFFFVSGIVIGQLNKQQGKKENNTKIPIKDYGFISD